MLKVRGQRDQGEKKEEKSEEIIEEESKETRVQKKEEAAPRQIKIVKIQYADLNNLSSIIRFF